MCVLWCCVDGDSIWVRHRVGNPLSISRFSFSCRDMNWNVVVINRWLPAKRGSCPSMKGHTHSLGHVFTFFSYTLLPFLQCEQHNVLAQSCMCVFWAPYVLVSCLVFVWLSYSPLLSVLDTLSGPEASCGLSSSLSEVDGPLLSVTPAEIEEGLSAATLILKHQINNPVFSLHHYFISDNWIILKGKRLWWFNSCLRVCLFGSVFDFLFCWQNILWTMNWILMKLL